jgi:hypothetical protein
MDLLDNPYQSNKEGNMFPRLKRNKYFTGKLMSAEDFQDEQEYFIEKLRLHNRLVHGYGVVTGLEVSISDDPPGRVRVEPGFAIDRQGNDVILTVAQLASFPERGKKACVVIEYAEHETDFVPGLSSSEEEDVLVATRVEEDVSLKLEVVQAGEEEACCETGIELARLKKRGGVWRVDKRFEVKRLSVEG